MIGQDIIDMHAHFYPEGCFTEIVKGCREFSLLNSSRGVALLYRGSHTMSAPTGQEDLRARVRIMDETGVGIQVLSIGPLNLGWAGAADTLTARLINDGFAAVCHQYPERFRFVAALPHSSATSMLVELDRAMSLGAVGAGITTMIADHTLDSPKLRDFWREAHNRRLLVLIHPTFPPNGPTNDRGEFLSVGYLNETAMAATRLVLTGVLEECPNVRIVWSHCGGSLCMVVDRIDRGYKRYEKCLRPPSDYLRRCYYDTACLHGPALDCARATFGHDRLVYGTDEPHVLNATKGVLATLRERPWSSDELQDVLSRNALNLLEANVESLDTTGL
jgi:aminocarboxymuconate-semialdehyde decarboxylase